MFKAEIEKKLKEMAVKDVPFIVSFAPPEFGDYSTNLALVLAKKDKRNPMEVAEETIAVIKKGKKFSKLFSEIKALVPGFINFS